MVNLMAGGGLQKTAGTLAAADSVAHIAFFMVFGWRAITGNGFRVVQALLALTAMAGIASGTVGWAMIKTGGRGRARQLGMSAVALSTTLAGFLLMMASWTGE
ncbi:MAG: hypothetical protein ABI183_16800 [Polyangiaceae bacterium]